MKVTTRLTRFTGPALAIFAILLLVAVAPQFGFGRDAQRLWTERGGGSAP